MDEQTVTSAPDTSTPPAVVAETVSALDKAIVDGDQAAYKAAKLVARGGKAIEMVGEREETPTPEMSASDKAEQRQDQAIDSAETRKTRKQRDEQYISDRIREGVESGLRELHAAPKETFSSRPAGSAPPVDDPRPDPTNAEKYPDGQFDPKFIEDVGRWAARDEHRQLETSRNARGSQMAFERQQQARFSTFSERIDAAITAEPDFLKTIAEPVLTLKPTINVIKDNSRLPSDQRVPVGPLNDLADEMLDSEHSIALMRHFSAHPEDLQRFGQMRTKAHVLKAFAVLESTFSGKGTETRDAGAPRRAEPKTKTDAPTPPTTLGTKAAEVADDAERAVETGDQAAYKAARMRQRAALQGK
jgi:hypothetical protein